MRISEFDFHLLPEFIAQHPSSKRGYSRLLVLKRDGSIFHRYFYEIGEFFRPGDMVILNNTKVLPLRLKAIKPTGGRFEILLVEQLVDNTWRVLTREKYRGMAKVSEELTIELLGEGRARLIYSGNLREILWRTGQMPLPPYIKRRPTEEDKEWYQTVYAEVEGSVAAPTAGLHFTLEILKGLSEKGVIIRKLTLHVGPGTFRPIKTERPEEHQMESEVFEIPEDLIDEINSVKFRGGRIIATGTTTTRALEGFASGRFTPISKNGSLRGSTDIFIFPGYEFRVIDGLITNFHLPRSTPLLLVSAFAGIDNIRKAYQEAIAMGYRFFSYGDAMLII